MRGKMRDLTAPSPLLREGRGGRESRSNKLSTGAAPSRSGSPPLPKLPPRRANARGARRGRGRLCLLLALFVVFGVAMPTHAQHLDPGSIERQRRAMLEAAEKGDVSSINRVLMAGGSVNVKDDLARTPLHLAVAADRLDTVKLLLDEGADINAVAHDLDTPWLLAGARGRTEMLRLMQPKNPDFTKRNRYGGNALIPACHYGHVETVKFLLGTRIDVNQVNDLGWTCLLEAVILGDGGPRHQEIVRSVLKAGANPNIADRKGDTPLSHARAKGQTQIIAILEASGGR